MSVFLLVDKNYSVRARQWVYLINLFLILTHVSYVVFETDMTKLYHRKQTYDAQSYYLPMEEAVILLDISINLIQLCNWSVSWHRYFHPNRTMYVLSVLSLL